MSINMTNSDTPKKPAHADWHPADIKAALEKAGWSLSRLSRKHRYSRTAAAMALRAPWPKMEKLIAAAIDIAPQNIWPTRYHADGTPKSSRGARGLGRYKRKDITAAEARNACDEATV